MPVAGTIKLDIIADSQDRASATLRAVQGELRKTEDRIRSVSAAGKEDGDISDILSRGSAKSRSALRGEVDARELAAQKRREAVQAAREASKVTEDEVGTLGKLKGSIEGAARAKEFLNKALGLGGFVTIAVQAVSALADLLKGNSEYKRSIEEAASQQTEFNALVTQMQARAREFDLSTMMDPIAEAAGRAADKVKELATEWARLSALRVVQEVAAQQEMQHAVDAQEDIDDWRRKGLMSTQELDAAQHRITIEMESARQKLEEIEKSRKAEAGAAREQASWQAQSSIAYQQAMANAKEMVGNVKAGNAAWATATRLIKEAQLAQVMATPEYRTQLGLVREMVTEFGRIKALLPETPTELGSARKAIEAAVNAQKAALEKIEDDKKKRASGGESARKKAEREAKELADKETGIRREIAILEIQARYEDEYARKLGAIGIESDRLEDELSQKKIARSTYELQRRKLDLELNLLIAEESKRFGEEETKAEEKKREGIEKAAKAAQTAKEKSDKDAADALEKRAKGIERIGEYAKQADGPLTALSARLGGLAEAVDQTAGIWAQYERGQETVGDAVAGTLGFIGAAVAQSISDKQVQAGVEGGFEAAASIASFASGNVPAGIGHAAAAAAFFGVAAGGGASSGASTGAASGRASSGSNNVIQGNFGQSSRSSRPEDTRTVIVHHYGQGIIYGQGSDVARAGRNADRSLAGTGMQNTGY